MEKELKKFCDVGQHKVSVLWRSRKKDIKNPGQNIQDSCCKNCMSKVPKKVSKEKMEVKQGLNVFFANQALQFPFACENCNQPLNARSSWDKRKSTCHILPKSEKSGFPTVAIHASNRVFMCCDAGCYGHDQWDGGDASDRLKMPVYSLAIERFRTFEDLLTSKEKIKAYKYLGL